MPAAQLQSQSAPERVPEHMGLPRVERCDEPGEGVGVVGQTERLRGVRGLPASGRVPCNDRELVPQVRKLRPPCAAILQGPME